MADPKDIAEAFKKALEEEAKTVALATHGVRALGDVMRGNLVGGAKQAASALAFLGPQGKVAAAGVEVTIGALESLWNTALSTTAKFNPGLVRIYNDALDDLHAAMGEGLYPIVKEMIPYLRSMADWLHNNSKEIRAFTSALIASGNDLRSKSIRGGLLGGLFELTKGKENSSVGLAAQSASYSDVFEAGDRARLAIAEQQATAAEQVANNTSKANDLLVAIATLIQAQKDNKVLNNVAAAGGGAIGGEKARKTIAAALLGGLFQ